MHTCSQARGVPFGLQEVQRNPGQQAGLLHVTANLGIMPTDACTEKEVMSRPLASFHACKTQYIYITMSYVTCKTQEGLAIRLAPGCREGFGFGYQAAEVAKHAELMDQRGGHDLSQ